MLFVYLDIYSIYLTILTYNTSTTLLYHINIQQIAIFSRIEATKAAQQLQDLRAVTGGTNNVTVATLQDVGQNIADVLSLNPLISTTITGSSGSIGQLSETVEGSDIPMSVLHTTARHINSSTSSSSSDNV